MPNTKSAKKRLRQSEERRERNRACRSEMRTRIRNVQKAVAAGDAAKADELLKVAVRRLDQFGSRGLIHPNKAARTKSRLTRLVVKLKKAPAAG